MRQAFVMLILGFSALSQAGQVLIIEDAQRQGSGKILAEREWRDEFECESGWGSLLLLADLEYLGFDCDLLQATETHPGQWADYDLLVYSCSDNPDPLQDIALRYGLRDHVEAGRSLLIEGGEVAYRWHAEDPAFTREVLLTDIWLDDLAGDMIKSLPHPLQDTPVFLADTIGLCLDHYTHVDAVTAVHDALTPFLWSDDEFAVSLLAWDPNPQPEGGQVIFLPFSYSQVDSAQRRGLMANVAQWLTEPEVGTASVLGTITLEDGELPLGARVRLQPGGHTAWADSSGSYRIDGLFGQAYTLQVFLENYAEVYDTFTLAEGEELAGLDYELEWQPVLVFCQAPLCVIPDNDPLGAADTIWSEVGGSVDSVAIFVDITHTWVGDLVISATSPGGRSVLLHNRGGGSADNLLGWYPDDLTPLGDLAVFGQEPAGGAWSLQLADLASGDEGTLNSWCVLFYWDEGTDVEAWTPSAQKSDFAAMPNPFNPATSLSFTLPAPGEVSIDIFDVAGRRARRLLRSDLPAGTCRIEWDGRGDNGQVLPSGVYLARLATPETSRTVKLQLIK